MATADFSALLSVSASGRPNHVPADYIRVDHWGIEFDGARFSHYETNTETKRYWKAVRERVSRKTGELVIKPGRGKRTGTWVHPLIASHYAGWLNAEFAVLVNETFLRVVEGDSDLAADMMIRDHNKDRVDKAMKRVKVAISNKELNELSKRHERVYWKAHQDKAIGMYGKSVKQLKAEGKVPEYDTPWNYMSSKDLSYSDAANAMVIEADNPDLMVMAANGMAVLHKQITGRTLTPTWDEKRLTPNQARVIAYAPEYQGELPI